MAAIRLGDDKDIAEAAHTDIELIPGANNLSAEDNAMEQKKLQRASLIAKSMTAFLTIALLILWPMPMYGSEYIFSKKVSLPLLPMLKTIHYTKCYQFFTGWVTVGILWLFCSAFCVGLFPLWEGRHSMANTFKGIFRDLTGKGGHVTRGRVIEGTEAPSAPAGEKAETSVTEKVPSI